MPGTSVVCPSVLVMERSAICASVEVAAKTNAPASTTTERSAQAGEAMCIHGTSLRTALSW